MKKPENAGQMAVVAIVVGLVLLTALGSAWAMLGVAVVGLLVLAALPATNRAQLFRARNSWFVATAGAVIAAIISLVIR